ncbi:MAG: hypothetical protein B7Y26_01365 [Hydrogenophilales bacterium 16-64-46]|nr:MAG: hypothetical protein B7Z32_08750 [Hydrogenophilales bacterium 12-64-13]OYZ07266.1 MAG: hypothetical protein B7Y26_01365 [Hydrogenophilales bacterium 16-64-46]OZA37267.1 MAG: hypothetical protein B7X87_11120 [Hydrogenophilales bacterium 17-64-34]HQS98984.1 SURF1 family protein [Thiobacillus sp.]
MHLLKLRVGRWVFAPTLLPTLAALFFFLLTLWLGNWQSGRAEEKRAMQVRVDAAMREPPVHVGAEALDRVSVLDRRIEVTGRFDDAHTILLDNRVYQGRAGYHVLTPLRIEGGTRALLVNRGWLPAGADRSRVPHPPVATDMVHLEGRAIDPHSRYLELGNASPQGRVWQNLDFERYAAQVGLPLQPVLMLQTSPQPDGLMRDWPRPDTGVVTHVGYAFQWYSLASTLAVLWLALNIRRAPTEPARGEETKKKCP